MAATLSPPPSSPPPPTGKQALKDWRRINKVLFARVVRGRAFEAAFGLHALPSATASIEAILARLGHAS